MSTTRIPKGRKPNPAEQHAEWLALLAPEGPFLSLPVLIEALPSGVEALNTELRDRTRRAFAEFDADPHPLAAAWIDFVLAEVLRLPAAALRAPADVGFTGTPHPDRLIQGPDPAGGRATRCLLYRRPAAETHAELAELADRAARLGRDTGVPLALVTGGRYWLLVHAEPGGPTSVATFDADLWSEEPLLLRAFATLLGANRLLAPPRAADGTPSASLAALFTRTAEAQAQITTTLGAQVRGAVELFVAEIALRDRESAGALLHGVFERDLYRGSLTTLLRLVFLLYAEQRELLPIDDPVYAGGYAVSTLYRRLTEDREAHGEEVLDRRRAAWPRLLATFRAVHGGCEHPDLRIPAHGGDLFDPQRYPWLARAEITDRVVFEVLDALLVLRHRGKAPQRLSYTGLDVEQIGHVYEGLLEFSCLRITEPYIGLLGKYEPELPLAEYEAHAADDTLREWLLAETGATPKQLDKALATEPGPDALARLHAACDNDAALAESVRPLYGLLRTDLRGGPTVFPAGSILFTQVGDRRSTGTHYTPKSLAQEVVEHTLRPLSYVEYWTENPAVRTEKELLALKVCDPTMGSGAFLVAATRYLAERLREAWARDGRPADIGGTDEEILLTAKRLVAARCIYGVDRDDMAVDLAKLSMWLETLARHKPFGFLDHALRCGDSLIGVRNERQIEMFHLDPENAGTDAVQRLTGSIDTVLGPALDEATRLRREIEATPVDDLADVQRKQSLLRRADEVTDRLRLAADGVVAAALSTTGQPEERYTDRLTGIVDDAARVVKASDPAADSPAEAKLRLILNEWLTGSRTQAIRPFHWPLEFPEVMRDGGFDAVVGNPPFIGGKRVTSSIGHDVREYLVGQIANHKRGNADLCSYFLLRNLDIAWAGRIGIIATNTIAQGDTREVGLDQATNDRGWQVYRAVKSQRWPGTASLEVSLLWVGHTAEGETYALDGSTVAGITPSLDPKSRVTGNPHRLKANEGQSFIGSYILGSGFLLEPEQAQDLIRRDPSNRDVLFPYLNGENLNSTPDNSATRWVINFHDWSINYSSKYSACFSIVEEKVKPQRLETNQRDYRELWWRFARIGRGRNEAVKNLRRVLAISLVSKVGLPLWVPMGQVYSHMLGIFAVDRNAYLSLLSSAFHHHWWTSKGESTLENRLRYTPTDGFETFPQPELTGRMDRVGEELHGFRQPLMIRRQLGLTKLYNLVHDEAVNDEEIQRLREIHVEVDEATAEAYGWTDLDLGHGFHDTRQGRRFTISPAAREEVLARLLELNFERYAEEVRQGLHNKKGSRPAKSRRSTPARDLSTPVDGGLF